MNVLQLLVHLWTETSISSTVLTLHTTSRRCFGLVKGDEILILGQRKTAFAEETEDGATESVSVTDIK